MTASHQNKTEHSSVADGPHNSFIQSMSTLFDIMDDRRTGYVKFTDIERRWHEDGTQGLPRGVLDSLRKVTPPNGYLSFERFCTGLKMSLIKPSNHNGLPLYPKPLVAPVDSASSLTSLEEVDPSNREISTKENSRPVSAPVFNKGLDENMSHKTGPYDPPVSKKPISMQSTKNGYNSKIPHMTSAADRRQMKNETLRPSIRMGTANKPQGNPTNLICQGPPKPPRVVELEKEAQTIGRSDPKDMAKSTHSLEREARSHKRNVVSQPNIGRPIIRRNRGGSLERLLDDDPSPKEKYGTVHLHSKTGMRSALQTWFKERSKSDLQKQDTNNNYHTIHKIPQNRPLEHYKKNTRGTSLRPSAYEPKTRGNADGVEATRQATAKYYSTTNSYGTYGPSQASRINPSVSAIPPTTQNDLNEAMYARTTVKGTPLAHPVSSYNVQAYNNYNDGQTANKGATVQPKTHGKYVAPPPSQIAINKKTAKKKEPRRHTLQNGIDYNSVRKLQQMEAERDMLYQGLDVVERARVWYKQQLSSIAERIHYLPLSPTKEPILETQREKMHFQLARIHEINAHLRALMDPEKSMQSMNLAIRTTTNPPPSEEDPSSRRLKEQNKLLTEEVSMKSNRITSLEREKAALLRELFQAKAASQPPSASDSFM